MKDKLFCKKINASYKTGSLTKQILNNVSIEGSSTTPNGLQLYLQLQSEMSTLTKAPENE